MLFNQTLPAISINKIIVLCFLIASIVSLTHSSIEEAKGLPSEDDIMAEIDKEAERINDIIDQKIQSHPGLGNIYSYCYDSVEALLQCQNEVVEEMEPYYEDAGKRIGDKIESNDP
jgi:hypothetical protein